MVSKKWVSANLTRTLVSPALMPVKSMPIDLRSESMFHPPLAGAIMLTGIDRRAQKALHMAVSIEDGSSILWYDLETWQSAVLGLPWHAIMRRFLPSPP